MQTENLLLQEPRVTNTNGSVVVTMVNSIDQHFWFTGFGPNPDPFHKEAVPGGYDKYRNRVFNGTTRYVDVYQGSQIYFKEESGVSSEANSHLLSYATWEKDANVYNKALSKLNDKVKDHQANIMLSLGEARETGRMFKAFRSVSELLTSVRKFRKDLKTNPSKLASELWLGYQYGVRPLLGDIHSYLDWTYHTFKSMDFNAKAGKTVSINDSPYYAGYSGKLKSQLTGARSYRAEIGVTVGVEDNEWFNASRLTSMNPLSLAWELTTLSFVADWFIDIGGYLENLESSLATGLRFERGFVTQINKFDGQEILYGTDRQDYGVGSFTERSTYLTSTIRRVNKERLKLGGYPLPRLPSWNFKLGSTRMLSAGALIRTVVLGDLKGRRW
jgi:hypothetical protein